MRTLLIDIGLTILLASTIIWFHLQPSDPISLDLVDSTGKSTILTTQSIVLFWNLDVKASHRDIQLIQRFHQAHPDIQTIFIHDRSTTNEELQNFLISLGVYATPIYSSSWPKQIPTTILINGSERADLNHSPHYSTLMEFFGVEF